MSSWLSGLPIKVALGLSVLYTSAAAFAVYYSVANDSHGAIADFWKMLALNEWGDFLAGICGPLALIWIVASVYIQGAELRDQRMEMSRQAEALFAQSEYIRAELERDTQDKVWRDVLDLLDELREQVSVANADDQNADSFITFTVETEQIKFQYAPPAGVRVENLRTVQFLGRAAGGVKHAARKLRRALDGGQQVKSPHSRKKFQAMLDTVESVLALRRDLPGHKELILKGCRLDDWREYLKTALDAFDQSAKNGK